MKLLCRRVPKGLRPLYEADEEELSALKLGDVVTVEVKKARNPKHHALYFALVGKVWQNVDHRIYPTKKNLHNAFKFAAGIREAVIDLTTGEEVHKVGSIAFDEMDQAEFDAFYNKICDLVCEHFLPGVANDELRLEISSMIGLASPAVAAE